MAGIEQRGGQPQPEQPSQPEQTQPQQGRAEGRQSLQGPTTVDRSDPADRRGRWRAILQQEAQKARPKFERVYQQMRQEWETDRQEKRRLEVPADGGHQSTPVQQPLERRGAVFDCISLMPSDPERVEEMLEAGHITEAEAAQEMLRALAYERVREIRERMAAIQEALRASELSATERQRLRADYSSLRKEDNRLVKQI